MIMAVQFVRDLVLARIDPSHSALRSQRPTSVAQPLQALGSGQQGAVVYLSAAAEALLGPEAASLTRFDPPPLPRGLGIDLRA